MDLAKLRRDIEAQIDTYVYDVPPGAYGDPLPAEWVERALHEFRSALVDPYWLDVINDQRKMQRCIIVADDRAKHLLAFDPDKKNFSLVERFGEKLMFIGVDGDAVGCFLAR